MGEIKAWPPGQHTLGYIASLITIFIFLIQIGSGVSLSTLPEFGFLDSFPSLIRFLIFVFFMPILNFYCTKLWSASIRLHVVWLSFSIISLISLIWINYSITYIFFDEHKKGVIFFIWMMHFSLFLFFVSLRVKQIYPKFDSDENIGWYFFAIFPFTFLYIIVPAIPDMFD